MKKRIFKTFIAGVLCLATCMGAVACGSNEDLNDPNTLRIAICNMGYGREWLDDSIELFKEQDWVKTKYPELKFAEVYEHRDAKYSASQVALGSSNKYDLLFSTDIDFKKVSDNIQHFEDLTPLLEDTVPGESVKIGEKMKSNLIESSKMKKKDDLKNESAEGKIYGMPWVDGYQGLVVNDSLVKAKLGDKFTGYPRTSAELVAFAQTLKDNTDIAPFVFKLGSAYWGASMNTWWAQYEGESGYYNYFEGKVYDENGSSSLSPKIGDSYGKLYAMQALENIINKGNGYCHNYLTVDFTQTQANFYKREAFMMPNGDWVENEMASTIAIAPAKDDNIIFMQFPIVSQIVEKLSFGPAEGSYNACSAQDKAGYESKLTAIIDQIDLGKTYEQADEAIDFDFTKADYDKVKEARGVCEGDNGHVAHIPSYAVSKELAKDFLRFLSTDIAIEAYVKATGGCQSPYEFDYSSIVDDSFNITAMHASVLAIKNENSTTLRSSKTFPMVYYGGLTHNPTDPIAETPLYNYNSSKAVSSGNKNAQKIWEDDKADLTNRWESVYLRNSNLG